MSLPRFSDWLPGVLQILRWSPTSLSYPLRPPSTPPPHTHTHPRYPPHTRTPTSLFWRHCPASSKMWKLSLITEWWMLFFCEVSVISRTCTSNREKKSNNLFPRRLQSFLSPSSLHSSILRLLRAHSPFAVFTNIDTIIKFSFSLAIVVFRQKTRELISARKTSHEHDTDPNSLKYISIPHGMRVKYKVHE